MRYLDPIRDRKTLSRPTAIEVLNLVTYGSFNYERCLGTLPRAEYVVPRQRLAREATERLKVARCLIVHSRIGNGKTIFLYILSHMLSQQGYRCFFFSRQCAVASSRCRYTKDNWKICHPF